MATIDKFMTTELLSKFEKALMSGSLQGIANDSLVDFHEDIASELVDSIKDNFHREKDVYGNDYEPLNEFYQDYKKGDPNQPILVDTGAMRDSINYIADEKGFDINHNTPYGDYHQFGMGKNPQRKFIPEGANEISSYSNSVGENISLDSEEAIDGLIERFIDNVLNS